jgi:hypothetical protein
MTAVVRAVVVAAAGVSACHTNTIWTVPGAAITQQQS